MALLECTCRDASTQPARSKVFDEYDDDEKITVYQSTKIINGNCTCRIGGQKISGSGIRLVLESDDVAFAETEMYEEALEPSRSMAPAVAFAAPKM